MSSNRSCEPIFALVDCNSFYASCERVFNPALRKRPVVVLSNNDGCIIALTPEAKAVGIKMGGPLFEYRDLIKKHCVAVFSSNYTLYGDMSARVMQTLSEFTPDLEIYSIDEAFLGLSGFKNRDLITYGQQIKQTVYQYTGIPVSVGIGPTKVLAKLANRCAKKHNLGTFSLHEHPHFDRLLETICVGDIWGIGHQSREKLKRHGIHTALNLKNAPPKVIKKILTVVGERIQNELNGVSCLALDDVYQPKKQIISTRSFGELLTDFNPICEAIANHVTRAAKKLRDQNSVCFGLQIFIQTSPFRNQDQPYYGSQTTLFLSGVSETNILIGQAIKMIETIYREKLKYKKCGVMLFDLHSTQENQMSLFEHNIREPSKKTSEWMDKINARFGTDTVKFAACGTQPHWQMRSDHRSPRFTTHWDELLEV